MQVYILKNGEEMGPYSLEELNDLLESEAFHGDDLCWHEGCEDWMPLTQLPGYVPPVSSQENLLPTEQTELPEPETAVLRSRHLGKILILATVFCCVAFAAYHFRTVTYFSESSSKKQETASGTAQPAPTQQAPTTPPATESSAPAQPAKVSDSSFSQAPALATASAKAGESPSKSVDATPAVATEATKASADDKFMGSLFDYLTKLTLLNNASAAIDPFCLSQYPEILLSKVRVFPLSPAQGIEAYLLEICNDLGLSLHKIANYYLITDSRPSTLEAFRKEFLGTPYTLITSRTGGVDAPARRDSNDPVRDFYVNLGKTQRELAERRANIQQLASKCRSLQSEGIRYEKGGSTLSPPDLPKAQVAWKEFQIKVSTLNILLTDSWNEAMRFSAPDYFKNAEDSRALPNERLTREFADIQWRLLDVFQVGIENSSGIYSNGDVIASNLDLVKRTKVELEQRLKDFERSSGLVDATRKQALDLWTKGKINDAYREFERSYNAYSDRSPRTRLGLGVLLLKNRADRVSRVISRSKGGTLTQFEEMAGLDNATQQSLKQYLGSDVPTIAPRVRHVGRVGSSYGLSVNAEGLSTFRVEEGGWFSTEGGRDYRGGG